MFQDKNVLITGGTGMIGRALARKLIKLEAHVTVASLDNPIWDIGGSTFDQVDLRHFEACVELCEGMDYVFHLAGIKGSPAMTAAHPASFFTPTIMFNTNMLEAARLADVKGYLYTSSIGVYSPAMRFCEDDMWLESPSLNDRFAGHAKRMGELQCEAYAIEYDFGSSIVRPANTYGPYDNFDPNNAMVIPSLIARAMGGENPLIVWGNGNQVRDFVYCDDVADGMILAMEQGYDKPINLGSGIGYSVKQLVEAIVSNLEVRPEVIWDTSKPSGDAIRVMDIERAKSIGYRPKVSLEEGIKLTMSWYKLNAENQSQRFNIFK